VLTPVRVNPVVAHPNERRLILDGLWSFRLDPDDVGLAAGWHADPNLLTDTVSVPGSWQGQGLGGDGNDIVWDFRLEARTFRATYRGTGWYARGLTVPDDWGGGRIFLNFGGAFPTAEVFLDGQRLGEHGLPFVPFGFDVTDLVRPGSTHNLAVRIHEADRELGLAFSYQGNWSGLYRGVELRATGPAFLEHVRAYSDVDRQSLTAKIAVAGDAASLPLDLSLSISRDTGPALIERQFSVWPGETEHEIQVPSPDLWSPDAPNLYRLDVELRSAGAVLDAWSDRFGFVKLSTEGKHFLINDQPYYMRGTGEFLSNPETGCPDTDRERWRRKLRVLRDYGYNYARCQSFVPAPEYYDVADEVGLLVQSEMGMLGAWGGMTPQHIYAWPQPTPAYREALRRQWNLVVERDVNHPSANIYCMSNELGASTYFPRIAWQCCHDTRRLKPSCMVIWTDGGLNNDLPQDFVNAEASQDDACAKPLIQHEFRWWSSYPDVRIMKKYSGAIRPWAQEIALEAAARHGLTHLLPLAAEKSQRLQSVESKTKMEICRRDNPRLAGICHFNAMDGNPSPQGVLDEFYETKVAGPATWLQTNGDTVLLSSLGFDDRVLIAGDTLRCAFSVSDFSHPPLREPLLRWALRCGDETMLGGEIAYAHHPFRTCPAGEITVAAPALPHPVKVVLEGELTEGERSFTNEWDLWILPCETPDALLPASIYGDPRHSWLSRVELPRVESLSPERGVVLTERLDDALVSFMRRGGRVLLVATEGLLRPFNAKFGYTLGHYYFTPPAQYPPYEDGHDGTILADHPALGDLPHDGWADLLFFRMIADAPPLDLEPLGLTAADPILRVLHSYPVCRPLGYLYEGGLGDGGLLLSALNLDQAWAEARYLLRRLCSYTSGGAFRPPAPISDSALSALISATALP
jgi:hypothetical protein